MDSNCKLREICIAIVIIFTSFTSGIAQTSSLEFWPEVDVWYKLTPSWRLSAYLPITKYLESKTRDFNIYLQADYAWGKTKHPFYAKLMDDARATQMKGWLARIGFMEGWSLFENAGEYTEDMLYAEIHKRVPLKGEILLSHRFRTDIRWVGNEADFSYRFRYRLMVEKEYTAGRTSIIPYVNAEPFWDSRYSTVTRIRVIGGTTVSWGPRIALEGNFTYQYDSRASVTNVYALNIILHLYFETARSKGEAKKSAQ